MTDPKTPTSDPAEVRPDDPAELRRDIDETREELGETVEALAQKADIRARVAEKVDEQKAALRERQAKVSQTAQERPGPAIGVALAVGLLLGWFLKRR
jgi:ElaB/YqjD/DUF883 family membrane-anchored ribosome-binding protein